MWRPTNRARIAGVVLLATVSMGCSADAGTPVEDGASIAAAGFEIGSVARSWVPGLADSVFIHAGLDIEAWNGRLVIAEIGVPSLTLLHPDLSFDRTIGSEGEGPGEFRNVLGTTSTPDGSLAVIDSGNDRITLLDADGHATGTVRYLGPGVSGVAALGSGRFAFAVPIPDEGDLIFTTPDSIWATGTPPDPEALPRSDAALAMDLDGEVSILRLRPDGAVDVFDAEGEPRATWALPAWFEEPLRARRENMEAAIPGMAGLNSLTKDFLVPTPDGRVLVFATGAPTPLIVLDARTGSWSVPTLPPDDASLEVLTNASSATLLDGRLYVLGVDRVDVLPIQWN